MNNSNGATKRIIIFLVLTVALSLPWYIVTAKTGEPALLLLLAPGLAAMITRFIFQRNVRDLGWKLMKTNAEPR